MPVRRGIFAGPRRGAKMVAIRQPGRLEKRFSAKDLARTELGSHVICEGKELLYEEAPQAYKNITIVIDDLVNAGLVDVLAVMRPLVTYKVRR
jgi:release factor H-coupled RctB family protein